MDGLVADLARSLGAGSMVIGTAQWGQHYGIANVAGPPSDEEIRSILGIARRAGFNAIDTARAYGESEQIIGRLTEGGPEWLVMTKLAPDVCPPGTNVREAVANAEASVHESLEALRREILPVLMLHRADQHGWAVGQSGTGSSSFEQQASSDVSGCPC